MSRVAISINIFPRDPPRFTVYPLVDSFDYNRVKNPRYKVDFWQRKWLEKIYT